MCLRAALGVSTLLCSVTAASADPVTFDIATCINGDCTSYSSYNGGSVIGSLSVIGGDLVITLENDLFSSGSGGPPYVQKIAFTYQPGTLENLQLANPGGFTVLQGFVAQPTLTVGGSIGNVFTIDFGFDFSDSNAQGGVNRFNAMDPNEQIQLRLTTTSAINLSNFTHAYAKIGSVGATGANSVLLGDLIIGGPPPPVPEPATLALFGGGLLAVGLVARRRRRKSDRQPGGRT